ncbi:MAG: histidine kinase dimerization/phospho-acceptor domain-containing protein [Gemmatimonadota bacterium]|jgi:signal transduction histidine kinase
MPDSRPAYLIGPPCPLRDRLVADLVLSPEAVFEDVSRFLAGGCDPGVVLILEGRSSGDGVVRLLDALATGRGEWTPCLVREADGRAELRTVSLGWAEDLAAVGAFRRGDEDRLLELRRVLVRIARSRHDINNPLTSGMAETQLLLMDIEDGPTREVLETIQDQFLRIRDLVADTRGMRPGRD